MSDGKQGEAGNGRHKPQKGAQRQAEDHKHVDTGEHEKGEDKAHRETVKDAKGTAKYADGARPVAALSGRVAWITGAEQRAAMLQSPRTSAP